MKKKYIYLIIAVIILILVVLLFLRGSEDSWIKDSKGVWVKHGNPASVPDYVKEQQEAFLCAENLYSSLKSRVLELDSLCLGTCRGYAVDIVHVPRIEEDDRAENQCSDFREGRVSNFIELDKSGNVVRVVD